MQEKLKEAGFDGEADSLKVVTKTYNQEGEVTEENGNNNNDQDSGNNQAPKDDL